MSKSKSLNDIIRESVAQGSVEDQGSGGNQRISEISLKTKIKAFRKMKGSSRAGQFDDDEEGYGDSPAAIRALDKRAGRMRAKIQKKHGSKGAKAADSAADRDAKGPRDTGPMDDLKRRTKSRVMKGGPRKGKINKDDANDLKKHIRSKRVRDQYSKGKFNIKSEENKPTSLQARMYLNKLKKIEAIWSEETVDEALKIVSNRGNAAALRASKGESPNSKKRKKDSAKTVKTFEKAKKATKKAKADGTHVSPLAKRWKEYQD